MAIWRKAIGWTAVGIGALLIVVIGATLILLKSPAFHHYLITKIEQAAGETSGAQIEIQNLQLHIKTLTADIYGLTIHGAEAAGEKPLLQVQHARVGIRIISIFRHKVNLSELVVERPAVNLVINKEGQNNLPRPPPSQK